MTFSAYPCSKEYEELANSLPRYPDRVFAFAEHLGISSGHFKRIQHSSKSGFEVVDGLCELMAERMELLGITPLGLMLANATGQERLLARIAEVSRELLAEDIEVGWAYEWSTFWLEKQRYIAVNPAVAVDKVAGIPALLALIGHERSHARRHWDPVYDRSMMFEQFREANIGFLVDDESLALRDGFGELEQWLAFGYTIPNDILSIIGYPLYRDRIKPIMRGASLNRTALLRKALTEAPEEYGNAYQSTWDDILISHWESVRHEEFFDGVFALVNQNHLSEWNLGLALRQILRQPRWKPVTQKLRDELRDVVGADFPSLVILLGEQKAAKLKQVFHLYLEGSSD